MTRALHTFSTSFVPAATISSAATPVRAFMIGDLRRETNSDALATRCALH